MKTNPESLFSKCVSNKMLLLSGAEKLWIKSINSSQIERTSIKSVD